MRFALCAMPLSIRAAVLQLSGLFCLFSSSGLIGLLKEQEKLEGLKKLDKLNCPHLEGEVFSKTLSTSSRS
jgi:hypothetical protein